MFGAQSELWQFVWHRLGFTVSDSRDGKCQQWCELAPFLHAVLRVGEGSESPWNWDVCSPGGVGHCCPCLQTLSSG